LTSVNDLVLPPEQKLVLREIAIHAANSGMKGSGPASVPASGVHVLFAGPSGTGKIMAAEALAKDLHLAFIRIDLSQVVSKFIGETEKNLRRVFDSAQVSKALLFFDEADALFGKRTEVRDSHDRFANVEVDYFLRRLEAYHGLAIVASNNENEIDRAFRFVVKFPESHQPRP
jgi:SpoVK/Ycf46/Vps4 family AAA+-type ATPase